MTSRNNFFFNSTKSFSIKCFCKTLVINPKMFLLRLLVHCFRNKKNTHVKHFTFLKLTLLLKIIKKVNKYFFYEIDHFQTTYAEFNLKENSFFRLE